MRWSDGATWTMHTVDSGEPYLNWVVDNAWKERALSSLQTEVVQNRPQFIPRWL
jgi:hypothetical protein